MDELYTMDRPRQMPVLQKMLGRGIRGLLGCGWPRVSRPLQRYTHGVSSRLRRFRLQLRGANCVQFSVRTEI